MDYNGLQKSYWEIQIERIRKLRDKISSGNTSPVGRTIPDDADLALTEGRRLAVPPGYPQRY